MTQLDKLREAVKNCGPVKITLGDTGVFEQEDKDVVIIHVLSTDLHNLRRKVENAVENTQTFPDYKPHITIAYVKKGKGKEYAEKLNTLKGKELTLDTLTFSDTDRNHVYFPLSKEAHQFLEDEDEFFPGHRVKTLPNKKTYEGRLGTVKDVPHKNSVRVVYDDGGSMNHHPSELSRVKKDETFSESKKEEWNKKLAAIRADKVTRLEQAKQRVGEANGIHLVHNKEPHHQIIIHPSTKEKGRWQLSRLDEHGPVGHTTFDSKHEALASAIGAHPNNNHGSSSYEIHSSQHSEDSYHGNHTAPVPTGKNSMHDLSDVYPEDIYSHKGAQYYGHHGGNHPHDVESIHTIHEARNRPNKGIKVYRAVPNDVSHADKIKLYEKHKAHILKTGKMPHNADTHHTDANKYFNHIHGELEKLKAAPQQEHKKITINKGDWVTQNKNYAHEHGRSALQGRYKIVSKTVPAKHLYTDGNSIHEWGYHPDHESQHSEEWIEEEEIDGGIPSNGENFQLSENDSWVTNKELSDKQHDDYRHVYKTATLEHIPIKKIHLHVDYNKAHISATDPNPEGGKKGVAKITDAMASHTPVPPAIGHKRADGYYHIEDGHHRISAAKKLKRKTIPLLVGEFHSQHEEQFAENDLLEKFLSQSLANQIQSTQQQIISLKSSELKLPELAQVVQQELRKLDQHLNQGLIHVGYQGAIEGTAEVVEAYEQLPAEQKVQKPTSNSVPSTPSIEGDIPTPPKPPKSPLEALGEPIPPEVRLPDLERSIMQLMRPTAMVGTDWKETAELVKAGAFAITGDIAQHQSTEVQLALAEAMSEGHSASEFIETVQEKIFEGRGPLSNSHLETIFRTNTLRQKSNAKERTLKSDLVSDAFPYRAYNATEDARTRPHHKALEHLGLDNTNIYNADDPVFLKYRPVWWYSCRCNHYGVTVVQAANKGVKEAVEWVDRAKQTAEIEGGSFYQYLNTTKPLFFQMVPPVPFNDPSFNDSTPITSQHEEQFGEEIPNHRIFYRGTVPGETKRIDEPFHEGKGKTFVARRPESAKAYGKHIEEYHAHPDAKILHQEHPHFWKLIGRRRPPNNHLASVPGGMIHNVNHAIRKAKEAGYHAVSFSHDSDVGTVLLDNSKFEVKPHKQE